MLGAVRSDGIKRFEVQDWTKLWLKVLLSSLIERMRGAVQDGQIDHFIIYDAILYINLTEGQDKPTKGQK